MKRIMSPTLPSHGPDDHESSGETKNQAVHENPARAMVEHVTELAAGVAILGTDANISSWNSQAEAMTGYTLEQVREAGLSSIFEPQEVMRHIIYKGCAGVPTINEYLQLRRADGQKVSVVIQCAPQRQLNPSECHLVLIFRKINTHIENLRQDEHMLVMGRFASSLSHEIRNQLNAVTLHTDVLEDILQDVPSETQNMLSETVVDIRHEINRLHDLVENFLSLARLSRLGRSPVMLATFFESLTDEIEPLLASQHIRLTLNIATDLGEVALHLNTFRHLWLNLIHNAIDAMPDGGEMTLRGERSNRQIYLTISDTGNGIAEDQLPLLFVPFHTTKPSGTGLGLYVVQEIAIAHDGWVEVTSEVGVGSSFTVTLPIFEPDDVALDAESVKAGDSGA
jgi:PAS domain S-box-containing protein